MKHSCALADAFCYVPELVIQTFLALRRTGVEENLVNVHVPSPQPPPVERERDRDICMHA